MIQTVKRAVAAPFVAALGMDVSAEIEYALAQLPEPPADEVEAIERGLENARSLQQFGMLAYGGDFMEDFEECVWFHHSRFGGFDERD